MTTAHEALARGIFAAETRIAFQDVQTIAAHLIAAGWTPPATERATVSEEVDHA